jgi:hypothetical protein
MEISIPEERQAFILAVLTIGQYYERIKLRVREHCVVVRHNGRRETEGIREHAEGSKVAGTRRGEVTNGSIKLHNEDLHNLNCSEKVIRAIKSRGRD